MIRYSMYYSATNGLPFTTGEVVTWDGGASSGVFVFDDTVYASITFDFTAGTAPTDVETIFGSSVPFPGVRITESLRNSDFTGWGGHRGTPGKDRAVKCPRCGQVMKEADLVVDGVTHTLVCTECYDPPTPPGNFRWPFRT